MSDAPAKLTVDGLELTLIRSDRRSLSLQLTADGSVVARAPRRMSEKRVVAFVREKRGWIEEKQALARKRDALYAPVELKDGDRLFCRDGERWRVLDKDRREIASGKLKTALPVLAGGSNALEFDCNDRDDAEVRIDIVKHYVRQ